MQRICSDLLNRWEDLLRPDNSYSGYVDIGSYFFVENLEWGQRRIWWWRDFMQPGCEQLLLCRTSTLIWHKNVTVLFAMVTPISVWNVLLDAPNVCVRVVWCGLKFFSLVYILVFQKLKYSSHSLLPPHHRLSSCFHCEHIFHIDITLNSRFGWCKFSRAAVNFGSWQQKTQFFFIDRKLSLRALSRWLLSLYNC